MGGPGPASRRILLGGLTLVLLVLVASGVARAGVPANAGGVARADGVAAPARAQAAASADPSGDVTSGASASFSLGAGSLAAPTSSPVVVTRTTEVEQRSPGGESTSRRLVRDLVIALAVAVLLLLAGITGLVRTRTSRYGTHR